MQWPRTQTARELQTPPYLLHCQYAVFMSQKFGNFGLLGLRLEPE